MGVPGTATLVGVVVYAQMVPFEFGIGGNIVQVTATDTLRLTVGSF